MRTHTKEFRDGMTPQDAHKILVEGNKRFANNLKQQRDLKEQVLHTSEGQFPFAVILSCIDSRVPAELVFDQGIGDIFSVRVAGNVINEDVLGSLEFACKVAGVKIVVVMGHTNCGAVTAACKGIEMGYITTLLDKIKPAIGMNGCNCSAENINIDEVNAVATQNVILGINEIKNKSTILDKMESESEIEIVGAMYSVTTGEVSFL